jgi:Lipase
LSFSFRKWVFFLFFSVSPCHLSVRPAFLLMPQDVVEDPVYIYRSVVKSYFEYKAAKEAAELAAKLPANLRAKAAKENEHVCYDGYGCFFKNGTYGNFWRLPLAPEEINTVFYLYTSAEQEDPEVLDFHNATTLLQSSFRADKPTIIMIHGFGSGAKASWNVAFRAAIFRGVCISVRKNHCQGLVNVDI